MIGTSLRVLEPFWLGPFTQFGGSVLAQEIWRRTALSHSLLVTSFRCLRSFSARFADSHVNARLPQNQYAAECGRRFLVGSRTVHVLRSE